VRGAQHSPLPFGRLWPRSEVGGGEKRINHAPNRKTPPHLPAYPRPRARDASSATPAEAKLWARQRNRQLGGFKFRRQQPIDRFIVDFYCAEARLVVELDGDSHTDQAEYDAARTHGSTRTVIGSFASPTSTFIGRKVRR